MQSYIQSHGGTRGPPPRPRGLPPRPRPDEFRTGRGARPRLPAVGSPRGLASAGPSLQRPRIVPSFGGRGLPPRPRSHSHQASTVPGGKGGPRPRGPPKVFRTEKRRNALQLDGLAHRHAMAVGASLDFRIKQILNKVDSESDEDQEQDQDQEPDQHNRQDRDQNRDKRGDGSYTEKKGGWKGAVGLLRRALIKNLSDPGQVRADSGTLIKKGFMKKSGHNSLVSTGMKTRYFELTKIGDGSSVEYILDYFLDDTKGIQKGSIALGGSVLVNTDGGSGRFCVKESVDSGGKNYVMECNIDKEKEAWMIAISSAIDDFAAARKAQKLAEQHRQEKIISESEKRETIAMRSEEIISRQVRKIELAQSCEMEGCDRVQRYSHDERFCTYHRRRGAMSMVQDAWCKACGIGSQVDFKINKRRITYATGMTETIHAYSDTDSGESESESEKEDAAMKGGAHVALWESSLEHRSHRRNEARSTGGWVFRRGNFVGSRWSKKYATIFAVDGNSYKLAICREELDQDDNLSGLMSSPSFFASLEMIVDLRDASVSLQPIPFMRGKFSIMNSESVVTQFIHVQADNVDIKLFLGLKVVQLAWIEAIQACINDSSSNRSIDGLKWRRKMESNYMVEASFVKLQSLISSCDFDATAPKESEERVERESTAADALIDKCDLLDSVILLASRQNKRSLTTKRERRGGVGLDSELLPLLLSCKSQLKQIKDTVQSKKDPKSGFLEPPDAVKMNECASDLVLLVDALDQATGVGSETSAKCWWTLSEHKGLTRKEQIDRLIARLDNIGERILLLKLLLLRQQLTDKSKERTLLPIVQRAESEACQAVDESNSYAATINRADAVGITNSSNEIWEGPFVSSALTIDKASEVSASNISNSIQRQKKIDLSAPANNSSSVARMAPFYDISETSLQAARSASTGGSFHGEMESLYFEQNSVVNDEYSRFSKAGQDDEFKSTLSEKEVIEADVSLADTDNISTNSNGSTIDAQMKPFNEVGRTSYMATDFDNVFMEGWLRLRRRRRTLISFLAKRQIRRYFILTTLGGTYYLAYSKGPGLAPVFDEKHSCVVSEQNLKKEDAENPSEYILFANWQLQADTKAERSKWKSALSACTEELLSPSTDASEPATVRTHRRRSTPISISGARVNFAKYDNTVNEVLGSGTFGEVYSGIYFGQNVVMKVLRNAENFTLDVLDEFYEKAQLHYHLNHRNIVNELCFNTNAELGPVCLIFEKLDCTLHNFLFRPTLEGNIAPAITEEQLLWILIGVTRGLVFLHSMNIPHSNMKSANVLLDLSCKTAKVTDFGWSRFQTLLDGDEISSKILENPSQLSWMAPEKMIAKTKSTSEVKMIAEIESDVFSLYVLIWQMFTKKEPHADKSATEIIQQVCHEQFRLQFQQPMEDSLRMALVKSVAIMCSAHNPKDRPTMENILEQLLLIESKGGTDASSNTQEVGPVHRQCSESATGCDMVSTAMQSDDEPMSIVSSSKSKEEECPPTAIQNSGGRTGTTVEDNHGGELRSNAEANMENQIIRENDDEGNGEVYGASPVNDVHANGNDIEIGSNSCESHNEGNKEEEEELRSVSPVNSVHANGNEEMIDSYSSESHDAGKEEEKGGNGANLAHDVHANGNEEGVYSYSSKSLLLSEFHIESKEHMPQSTWLHTINPKGRVATSMNQLGSDVSIEFVTNCDLYQRVLNTAAIATAPAISKTGYINLESEEFGRFYFKLTKLSQSNKRSAIEFVLAYFTDATRTTQRGSIALGGSTIDVKDSCSFCVHENIKNGGTAHILRCGTEEDMKDWVYALLPLSSNDFFGAK